MKDTGGDDMPGMFWHGWEAVLWHFTFSGHETKSAKNS
jgi:hypothetical protein